MLKVLSATPSEGLLETRGLLQSKCIKHYMTLARKIFENVNGDDFFPTLKLTRDKIPKSNKNQELCTHHMLCLVIIII